MFILTIIRIKITTRSIFEVLNLVFDKHLDMFWKNDAFMQIVIVVISQILKNKIIIWSNCNSLIVGHQSPKLSHLRLIWYQNKKTKAILQVRTLTKFGTYRPSYPTKEPHRYFFLGKESRKYTKLFPWENNLIVE